MSSENADDLSQLTGLSLENVHEPRKLPRYSYTRECLLSFKELDVCKKLPDGIDESFLSELQQASSNSLFDQNRSLGGTYLQSSRRSEHGTGQTNRLESSTNYVRGSQGRWDTRSNESSDKDEAQAERDAFTQEPGKQYPNQPRRPWQNSERDGLLGRPSGYSGNTSQRTRGNAQFHLSKSNEPYQPPRPYKAPFSRRDKSDSINDETFGSSECPSQDQAEEERRRRELFQSMRKEQQHARERSQKESSNNKNDVDGEIDARAVNFERSEAVNVKNRDDSHGYLQGDSKYVSHSQQPAARPLIPPGFRTPVADKNSTRPSSEVTCSEAGKAGICGNSNLNDVLVERSDNSVEIGNLSISAVSASELKIVSDGASIPSEFVSDIGKASSLSQESSDTSLSLVSGLQQPPELRIDSLTSRLTKGKDVETTANAISDQEKSSSILDKLFKNANLTNGGGLSNFVEDRVKVDEEMWSPTSSRSSKFSQWFLEEKNIPLEDIPSKSLHSLLTNSDKCESQDSVLDKAMITESSPSLLPAESNTAMDVLFNRNVNYSTSSQEISYPANKPTVSPSVLTCEDLEQHILAEANVNISAVQPLASKSGSIIENTESQKADVNNLASQHLLSLLQKGGSKESDSMLFSNDFSKENIRSYEECVSSDTADVAEKSLTLETLFGPGFMKELHSVAAPLSGSVGGPTRTSNHSMDVFEDPFSSITRAPNSDTISEENTSNRQYEQRDHNFHEPLRGFEVSQLEGSVSAYTSNIGDQPAEIQLPEEENLITLGDSINRAGLDPFPVNSNRDELSLRTSSNVDGNSSIFDTLFHSRRTPAQPDVSGSVHSGAYDLADPNLSHHQLFGGPSLFPNQSSQAPLAFQQLGSHPHRTPQTRFFGSDHSRQGAQRPFATGMIPQQSYQNLGMQLDPSSHLPMPHNMSLAGNFPRHHLQFPRGASPSQSNQLPTYFPEMNSMQGLSLNPQLPPSYGGMGLPGNGLSQQETLELRRAMELRARTHPVGNSYPPGMHGAEHDMNFRYR